VPKDEEVMVRCGGPGISAFPGSSTRAYARLWGNQRPPLPDARAGFRHVLVVNRSSRRRGALAGLAALLALVAALPFATSAASAGSADGFLGRTLPEVELQDFFRRYQLAELARKATGYARVVVFRPARTPVPFEVAATIDRDEHVIAIQLWLRRSFVDGRSAGAGARDIVLKFLREAPPAEDIRQLDELANEIRHGDVASQSAAGSAPPGTGQTAKPSAGYLAFTGKNKSYQLPLGTSLLQILNYRDRFGEVLILQLVPIGNRKRERADRCIPSAAFVRAV
jgi:hypothetical protein